MNRLQNHRTPDPLAANGQGTALAAPPVPAAAINPLLWTLAEAAIVLRISERSLKRAVAAGSLSEGPLCAYPACGDDCSAASRWKSGLVKVARRFGAGSGGAGSRGGRSASRRRQPAAWQGR